MILDGLDERFGCSRHILQDAKGGQHLLLLTSRPYGVQSERRVVDLVVEHKGLNPEQVRSFANHLLSCSKVVSPIRDF